MNYASLFDTNLNVLFLVVVLVFGGIGFVLSAIECIIKDKNELDYTIND